MVLVSDPLLPPEPGPRVRPTLEPLVDQQRAAANRLGPGAHLLSRGDLAKRHAFENLHLNEMRCSSGLCHWAAGLLRSPCLADKLCETTIGVQENTTSRPQRRPQLYRNSAGRLPIKGRLRGRVL